MPGGRRAPPPPPGPSEDDIPPPLPSRPGQQQNAAVRRPALPSRPQPQGLGAPPESQIDLNDSVEYVEPVQDVQCDYEIPEELMVPGKPRGFQDEHHDSDDQGWPDEFSDDDTVDPVRQRGHDDVPPSSSSPPPPPPPPRKQSTSGTDTSADNMYAVAEGGEVAEDLYEIAADSIHPPPLPKVPMPVDTQANRTKKSSREEKKGEGNSIVDKFKKQFDKGNKDSAVSSNGIGQQRLKPPPNPRGVKPSTPAKPSRFGSSSTEPSPANAKPLPELPKLKKQDSEENASGGSVSSDSGGHLQQSGNRGQAPKPPPAANKPPQNLVSKVPVFPIAISKQELASALGQRKQNQQLPAPPVEKPEPEREEEDIGGFEIYEDAVSQMKLEDYIWFHGEIDRSEGFSRLKKMNMDGAFLVRDSRKLQQQVLMLWHGGQAYNLKIRQRDGDGKFAIGEEKKEEVAFPTLNELIEYHMKTCVTVFGSGVAQSVKLVKSPSKK